MLPITKYHIWKNYKRKNLREKEIPGQKEASITFCYPCGICFDLMLRKKNDFRCKDFTFLAKCNLKVKCEKN